MEAIEFRIENYFIDPEGSLQEVLEITIVDDLYLVNGINPELLKPVEITDNWLKIFGFIKEMDDHYFNVVVLQKIEGYFIDRYYGRQIKYVHQLQNLYFSLTGKELELK